MSGFQALVALRTSDDETAGALRAVRDGPPAAREAALAALTARARSSGDPDAWAAAALGHHFAGRHGEARRILGSLVDRFPRRRRVPARPRGVVLAGRECRALSLHWATSPRYGRHRRVAGARPRQLELRDCAG
jgi:hypothetical protein